GAGPRPVPAHGGPRPRARGGLLEPARTPAPSASRRNDRGRGHSTAVPPLHRLPARQTVATHHALPPTTDPTLPEPHVARAVRRIRRQTPPGRLSGAARGITRGRRLRLRPAARRFATHRTHAPGVPHRLARGHRPRTRRRPDRTDPRGGPAASVRRRRRFTVPPVADLPVVTTGEDRRTQPARHAVVVESGRPPSGVPTPVPRGQHGLPPVVSGPRGRRRTAAGVGPAPRAGHPAPADRRIRRQRRGVPHGRTGTGRDGPGHPPRRA